jgi:phosphoglycerate dehydrogenase-like enzyme
VLLMKDYPHIAVHNLHFNAELVAEMAVALLLSAAKFIVPCDRALRSNDWRLRYDPPPAMLLYGKTALVLGFGEIGQHIGRTCSALGMRVCGIRRHPEKTGVLDYPAEVHGLDSLANLLPQAGALLIALPGTAETTNLVSEAQIRSLPQGAVLVNVGRGAVVEQAALYRALKDGHLRAAGIDVWYNYPLSPETRQNTAPADFPFGKLDNVVMSPHRASFTTDSSEMRLQHLASLLNTIARGETALNRVDLDLGY